MQFHPKYKQLCLQDALLYLQLDKLLEDDSGKDPDVAVYAVIRWNGEVGVEGRGPTMKLELGVSVGYGYLVPGDYKLRQSYRKVISEYKKHGAKQAEMRRAAKEVLLRSAREPFDKVIKNSKFEYDTIVYIMVSMFAAYARPNDFRPAFSGGGEEDIFDLRQDIA